MANADGSIASEQSVLISDLTSLITDGNEEMKSMMIYFDSGEYFALINLRYGILKLFLDNKIMQFVSLIFNYKLQQLVHMKSRNKLNHKNNKSCDKW